MSEKPTKDSCLRTDGSGLADDSPLKVHEPTPTVDLDELAVASASGEATAGSVAVLEYPGYYAHEYRQDYYDYTPGRGGKKIEFLVLHFMAGSFWGSVDWNLSAQAQNSWHYGVAHDGYTIQTLSENDRAWHAANWYVNERSVGIEQAGNGTPEDWTDAMLQSSAKLAAGVVVRHGIPIDRQHIFGHSEVQGATHTDVGKHFPWDRFMGLVRQYAKGGSAPNPEAGTLFRVQSGAFSNRSNAETLAKRLKAQGFDTYIVKEDRLHKVQLGAFGNVANARRLVAILKGKGFEAIVKSGKGEGGQGGGGDMPDGSTHKGHRWRGWQPPKEPKASGSYIERAPTRWHTHWDERVADLAKQIEQKWPGVSCLTYIPGHPLEDWAIQNGQHSVSFDVWDKRGRGYPLDATTHEEIFDYVFNRQSIPIRYVIKRSGGTAYDWMWVRGTGWEKYYSGYTHSGHPHFTMALGPRANF